MIKETSLITLIGIISIIYNNFIYPYILIIINENTHNFFLVFISILVQLDNFSLLQKIEEKKVDNIMEEKNLKIISNQLYYICRTLDNHHYKYKTYNNQREKEIDKEREKSYYNNKIFNKSCNDLIGI